MIVILLLICYTRICTDCFSGISLLFDILYKLRFDNFLLNEDDNNDDNCNHCRFRWHIACETLRVDPAKYEAALIAQVSIL